MLCDKKKNFHLIMHMMNYDLLDYTLIKEQINVYVVYAVLTLFATTELFCIYFQHRIRLLKRICVNDFARINADFVLDMVNRRAFSIHVRSYVGVLERDAITSNHLIAKTIDQQRWGTAIRMHLLLCHKRAQSQFSNPKANKKKLKIQNIRLYHLTQQQHTKKQNEII